MASPSRPRPRSRNYYDTDDDRERERERRRRARSSRDHGHGHSTDARRESRSRGYHTDADRPRARPASRDQPGYTSERDRPRSRDHEQDRARERERARRERARRERERQRRAEEEEEEEVGEPQRPSERRRRRGHKAQDSAGALLADASPVNFSEEARRAERERQRRRAREEKETKRREQERERQQRRRREAADDDDDDESDAADEAQGMVGRGGPVGVLNAEGLAKLDQLNQNRGWEMNGVGKQREWEKAAMKRDKKRAKPPRAVELRGGEGSVVSSYVERIKKKRDDRRREREREKQKRVVSGNQLEKQTSETSWGFLGEKRGGGGGGGKGKGGHSISTGEAEFRRKRRKRLLICGLIGVIALVVIIAVAVTVSKKNSDDGGGGGSSSSDSAPSNSNLDNIKHSSIPQDKRGTYYDPFSWYDTMDFNLTYTDEKVGGLPIMGLFSKWDDDIAPNSDVPKLSESFDYGNSPIRGMNVGGWFSIEPFITPSFFEDFSETDGVIDEWTLTEALGPDQAAEKLEQHYSSFITKDDFTAIKDAGFDHVRIPFSYWAIKTYPGDPYVPMISWRYLLRAIEWCREHGLRVKLDIHGLPGSQNGWNHSGHQGPVGWLNGTDGDLNAQRSLDLHDQLSTFFSQPRYKNLVTMYGLCNEPRMVDLNTDSVVQWTEKAIGIARGNGIDGIIVFGDGFMGLQNWQGILQGYDKLLLDVHQYVIFNTDLIVKRHSEKLNFACAGWTQQMRQSQDRSTGFGPTMCGEWSQADTDCAENLNNVGVGSRWEGTMLTGNLSTSVTTASCPTNNNPTCECDPANAGAGDYSDIYKQWLSQFAQAQMQSFEEGWGWFYWTWKTESAIQWSYKLGLDAGILPEDVRSRDWQCTRNIEDFADEGLPEYY